MTNKFSVDFESLEKSFTKKASKSYRVEEVKDRIEKVAFDVVRFREDDGNFNLWKIQDSDEGQVIVALYGSNPEQIKTESGWDAVADKQANIHLYHNKEPIGRFASSKIGVEAEEVHTACRWLPEKLADDSFRERLFKHVGLTNNGDVDG